MTPIRTRARPDRRLRFQLQDILAVVVGYGMAALFFRAFWPTGGPPTWRARAGDDPLPLARAWP